MWPESKTALIGLGLLAAFINTLPLLLFSGGGDLPYQYTLIECFGRQFWQGDFYPRWCMNANAGYGSPMPIFYNLLPYYITSLLYPAFWLGAGMPLIYGIGVFLAAWVTFVTAACWLRSINGSTVPSMVCAAILLWLPYRMELVATRAAFTELWGFALLPILFSYIRVLACGERNVWPQIALVLTLCLLCHPVISLMGLIVSGMYFLFFCPYFSKWVGFASSVLLALVAASFHWYPTKMLLQYTGENTGGNMRNGWANYFADSYRFDPVHFLWGVFEPIGWLRFWHIGVMAAVLSLGIFLLRLPVFSGNRLLKREVMMWSAIALLSFTLFFSFSAPLWGVIQLFTQSIAPWRAASLPVFALVALLAILFGNRYNHRMAVVAITASMTAGTAMIQIPPVTHPDARALIEMTQNIMPYFNTFPKLEEHFVSRREDFYERFVFNRPSVNASLKKGGAVTITQWNNHEIALAAHIKHPDMLYIEQFYFPTWQALVNGVPAPLAASEDGTGRMTLTLPAGESQVIITHRPAGVLPAAFRWVCLSSFLSFLVMLGGLSYGRRT